MIPSTPAHPFIDTLKKLVLFFSLLFVLLQTLPQPFFFIISQTFTIAPFHETFIDLLFAPLSLLTLNFRFFSLQMVFDFLMINFFLSPLSSFVLSFLGQKRFIYFLLGSALSSCSFLHALSFLTKIAFLPTTLFAHVSLSILSFWALLNYRHTSTRFLFIPLNPATLISVSFLAAAMPSFLDRDWIKLSSLVFAMFFGVGMAYWSLQLFNKRRL